jgi:cytochrome d ubiquinol oxidase subunit II
LAAVLVVLLLGWGLAPYPYLINPNVTLAAAAAPTLHFILYAVPAGLAVLLPSLWLLFHVFKGEQARPGAGSAGPPRSGRARRAMGCALVREWIVERGRPARSWHRQQAQ